MILKAHWENGQRIWRRRDHTEGAGKSAPSVFFGSDGSGKPKTIALLPTSVFTIDEQISSNFDGVDYVITDDRELMLQFADKILMAPADNPRQALERKESAPAGMSRWNTSYNGGYVRLPSMELTIIDRDKVTDQIVLDKLKAGHKIRNHPNCKEKIEWCKRGVIFDGGGLQYDPTKAARQLRTILASERRLERNPTLPAHRLSQMVKMFQSIFFRHRLMKDVGFDHTYDTFTAGKNHEYLIQQLAALIKMTKGLYPNHGYRQIKLRRYDTGLVEIVDIIIQGLPDLLRKLVFAFFKDVAVNTKIFKRRYREMFGSFNQLAVFIFDEHRAAHKKVASEKLRCAVKARLQVFRKKQIVKYREVLATKEKEDGKGNS